MKTILEVNNLSLAYGKQEIARDISFPVYEGEVACIVGRSGCGKTTLFHALAGLSEPIKGDVILKGNTITGKPGFVSYMLQKDLLLPNKRIVDNVALPYSIAGVKLEDARQKAFELLIEFGLGSYANSWPHELSGGMRQRVALLRTYANESDVILLDEAFSALDAITRLAVRTWFFNATEKANKSVVAISHDIDEACLISDTIYVMKYDERLGYAKLSDPIINKRYGMSEEEYMLTDEFLNTKKHVMETLGM